MLRPATRSDLPVFSTMEMSAGRVFATVGMADVAGDDGLPLRQLAVERLGFRRLADDELTPGLERIRAHEASLGLNRWPSVCMRREPPRELPVT